VATLTIAAPAILHFPQVPTDQISQDELSEFVAAQVIRVRDATGAGGKQSVNKPFIKGRGTSFRTYADWDSALSA
jgi:hypothetical protein